MNRHYQWRGETLLLHCHVQPGARCTEVAGLHGERLKIRLGAAPVNGKANAELLAFLAGLFGVGKSHVRLLRGDGSRQKTIAIEQPAALPAECRVERAS